MTQRTQHPMSFFDDYDDQDIKDLQYGGQLEPCKKFVDAPAKPYEDASITKSWSPDDD